MSGPSWEDVRAAHRERERTARCHRSAASATFTVLFSLGVALTLALVATCYRVERLEGQSPDTVTLTVLWQLTDTFSVYDVELLRTLDCGEPPDTVRASRYGVADVDASFREGRPPPGFSWCYMGRVRVSGLFDCPDGSDVGCNAPWGQSPVLPVRTPNPLPPAPPVTIDTSAVAALGGQIGRTYAAHVVRWVRNVPKHEAWWFADVPPDHPWWTRARLTPP